MESTQGSETTQHQTSEEEGCNIETVTVSSGQEWQVARAYTRPESSLPVQSIKVSTLKGLMITTPIRSRRYHCVEVDNIDNGKLWLFKEYNCSDATNLHVGLFEQSSLRR